VGFCLFIKRELLDHIGLLDERFGIGLFDDDDLSLRTRRAGYRLLYTHGVFVHHFGSKTFQALGVDAGQMLDRNWEQFRDKWAQDPRGAEHLRQLYVSVPRPQPDPAKPMPASRRIAVVSLLFNWPSAGGGIMDTVGMVRGLSKAGYDVRHFYAQAPALGVGDLRAPLDTPSIPVPLGAEMPSRGQLEDAFRKVVGDFRPDCVIVTDSWTCKPVLARAAARYPYLLRFHGLEGVCPLNGIRFVADRPGAPSCQNHLLADADRCRDCVARHQGQTGTLHAAERALSGAPADQYVALLREALADSAGVLVNNPFIANLLGPHAPHVSVATPGMDVAQLANVPPPTDGARPVILFPSLWEEGIKGYHVLEEASARLRSQGRDFEVRVAGPKPGRLNEWTTCVGWYPQDQLAELYAQGDIVVVPSVCEEAFGIVAAEGSAAGRPVIASRIGGLQFTVEGGVTGLLFEPGNAEDLAAKLAMLLADEGLRRRMGEAGRARALRLYAWEQVMGQAYEPVLARVWAETRG
jgi:glycosyltransferase involved in cell wall biosynthesis